MRRVVVAGLAVLWLGALAGTAAANDFTLCFKSYNDTEQGVAACTRVLASKRLRPIQRARTYLTRGTHHSRMGQYAAAIGDFNKVTISG